MSFEKVKQLVNQIGGLNIVSETENGQLIVTDEAKGVNNMVVDVNESVLILEQMIGSLAPNTITTTNLLRLLELNRELVHGSFVVAGNKVLFRDTLQTENLDLNEIQGSLNALTMGLTEFGDDLTKIVS